MKKVYRCHVSGFQNKKNVLNRLKIPYKISSTQNSDIISYSDNYGDHKFIYAEGMKVSVKELILQKKLKKEIIENTKDKKIKFHNKKIYFNEFDSSLRYMVETTGDCLDIKNVIEMDITKAYYQVAFNLGYISKKFFEVTLKLPKHIRLRLLGSIATKKIIETFENGESVSFKIIEDLQMRDIWFSICYEVGRVMKECSKAIQEYFIFYWVDGIYFQRHPKFETKNDPVSQIIQKIFQKNSLKYSVTELEKISLQNINNNIMLQCWKDGKIKSNFSVPHKKMKKYVLSPSKEYIYGD